MHLTQGEEPGAAAPGWILFTSQSWDACLDEDTVFVSVMTVCGDLRGAVTVSEPPQQPPAQQLELDTPPARSLLFHAFLGAFKIQFQTQK